MDWAKENMPFLIEFQSTHPRGVRPASIASTRSAGSFNPRTREGCDFATGDEIRGEFGFNPRTREGCDRCSGLYLTA